MTIIIRLVFLVLCVVTWTQVQSLLNHKSCGLDTLPVESNTIAKCRFSWVVAILVDDDNTLRACTGTIINELHVIAPAKCFFSWKWGLPITSDKLRVFYRRKHPSTLPRQRRVKYIFIHYNYSQFYNDYDIAILRLSRKIKLDQCIKPVCMISLGMQPNRLQNKLCSTITYIYNAMKSEMEMRWVEQPIVRREFCKTMYDGKNVTNRMFCAGVRGDTLVCETFTGGPIICTHDDGRYYLYGLALIVRQPDCGRTYPMYTKISSYLTWINEEVNHK